MSAMNLLLVVGAAYLLVASIYMLIKARAIAPRMPRTFLSSREIALTSRRVEPPPEFRTAWDFRLPEEAEALVVVRGQAHIDIVLPDPDVPLSEAARTAVPLAEALIVDGRQARWAMAA